MKNRYRVIRGVDGFYHSQIKRWWGWSTLPGAFGVESLCKARGQIEHYKNPRVCYEE